MEISIIIPAFYEERYLPETLEKINESIAYLSERANVNVELIVIDTASVDKTSPAGTFNLKSHLLFAAVNGEIPF